MTTPAESRSGEKIGWIGGWLGGFIWLLILSVIWLLQGQISWALGGLSLVAAAVACIFGFAPWRHPTTRYWKLLLPIYAVLFASVALAAATGGFDGMNLSWWSAFLLLPALTPFATTGARRWDAPRGPTAR